MNRRGRHLLVMAVVWLVVMLASVQGQQPQQAQHPSSPPPDLTKGYGNAYESGFKTLWGMK